MKALQLEHPVDEHLKPIKDADNVLTSMELSTNKLRVKAFESDTLTVAKSTEMTSILDEDDMASSSSTALSTQQAIKAYSDAVPLGAYSKTLIKVMPTEFFSNDDRSTGYAVVEDDTADTLGIRVAHGAVELYAFISIPSGYMATHIRVNASASTQDAVQCKTFLFTTGATTDLETFDFNELKDITDLSSTTTNALCIKLTPLLTGTIIYGSQITIAST